MYEKNKKWHYFIFTPFLITHTACIAEFYCISKKSTIFIQLGWYSTKMARF